MNIYSQMIINGLMAGLVYVLMALGFTLIFGIIRIVNFAHGELYMIGAFLIYVLYGKFGWNYFFALIMGGVIVALLGSLIEHFLFRQFLQQELNGMIMALAISIAFKAVALIIFGPEEFTVKRPFSGLISFNSFNIPMDRLTVGIAAITILIIYALFMHHTKLGLAMRAMAQDQEIASLMGIRVPFMYAVAFGIGSFLAAIAGGLMGPLYTIFPYMGEWPMLKAFIVVILGGLGSIPGAVIGGLIIGQLESFTATLLNTTISAMVSFAFVMLIMLIRPHGLLGRKT